MRFSHLPLLSALPTRLLFVALMLGLLSSCGGGPLSLLTGGGPNVAANVQAGAENNQGITFNNDAPKATVRPKARVDTIDQSQTTNQELPAWVWIVFIVLFVVGWSTDTPGTMLRRLLNAKR